MVTFLMVSGQAKCKPSALCSVSSAAKCLGAFQNENPPNLLLRSPNSEFAALVYFWISLLVIGLADFSLKG